MSETKTTKSMDEIVALCRRRGFIWQSSEIYGGINGFWDYGPLGTELKKNLKDAWWTDIVKCPANGPDGNELSVVGVDCTIIMHPKVWEASGHAAGFNDPMVDDKETKQRFRADHLYGASILPIDDQAAMNALTSGLPEIEVYPYRTVIASSLGEAIEMFRSDKKLTKPWALGDIKESSTHPGIFGGRAHNSNGEDRAFIVKEVPYKDIDAVPEKIPSPFSGKSGVLTKPRQFNLMFITYVGAVQDNESKAYLRPETAQGIFTQFWNVVDTSRVRVPFGIAQIGKAFRNEVTPRNFTFRSREFEQMEIEFFIRPETAVEWYKWWRESRYAWWQSVGLAGDNLQLREHDKDELSHYAKEGAGVCDVEYRFPFTSPGFGELEGIAHRADFDLKAHATACGKGDKMKYFDQELQLQLQSSGASADEVAQKSRYFPHVIEPSAGADRGTLAILCEAYTPDESRASKVYMNFTPRMAPIKAAIFPLVNKDGMPEIADKLYHQLRKKYVVQMDEKQSIGKRYARMDESGTPYCFTIDTDTLKDQTVTVRHRNTQQQERIAVDKVEAFLDEKIGG